jgi:hypothetical protein
MHLDESFECVRKFPVLPEELPGTSCLPEFRGVRPRDSALQALHVTLTGNNQHPAEIPRNPGNVPGPPGSDRRFIVQDRSSFDPGDRPIGSAVHRKAGGSTAWIAASLYDTRPVVRFERARDRGHDRVRCLRDA